MSIINTRFALLISLFSAITVPGGAAPRSHDLSGFALSATGDSLTTKTAEVPGCAVPTGFVVNAVSFNALRVRWDTATPSTLRFELVCIPKGAKSSKAFDDPVRVGAGNTWTFSGLEFNTAYDFFIRRVCQSTPPGGAPDHSDWLRISGATSAYAPVDCGFDTTLIAVTGITHEGFRFDLSPKRKLSPTGRRLLVRYRLTEVPPNHAFPPNHDQWQEKLIYDNSQLFVDHLYQGGTYEVYVKQLRNGSYMDYTMACPETGPFKVELPSRNDDCGYATSVTTACVGAEFVTLHFDGPALGYDDFRYLVAVKPALAAADDWQFYYHFSGAKLTIGDLDELTEYQLSAYLLVGRSGFDYDYLCGETILNNVVTLARQEMSDLDGDGIPDDCDPDDNDGPTGDSDGDGIVNQFDDDTPQNPFPQMSLLECGVAANIPAPNPSKLLPSASEGEILFINGFPILLSEVSGGGGMFSGAGVIGLPFPAKYLEVEFNNVQVDSNRVIFNGFVNGVSQGLGNFPDIPLDTITFGDAHFCGPVPEEEGFDENGNWTSNNSEYNPLGFNEDGQYQMPPYQGWEPGDPFDPAYDPNGFDAEGNHIETGTPYNPAGCSQTGFDQQGQPCNPAGPGPYYWLEPGTTEEGIALANEVEDTLRPLVLARLAELAEQFSDSILATKIRCDLTRDSMRGYFYDLGYTDDRDRIFIFGPGDDWFKEGMSRKFKEEPQKLGITSDRDPNEEFLEETHINLYHCDVDQMRYEAILAIIHLLETEPGITETVEHLKKLIQGFSADEAGFYADLEHLKHWIGIQLDSIIFAEYEASHTTGFIEPDVEFGEKWSAKGKRNSRSDRSPSSRFLAFAGDPTFDLILQQQAAEITWQDVVFEYHQGWEQVTGIDRAYFLEAICNMRNRSATSSWGGNEPASLLPLEISKDILGRTYTIYLDNISFTPQGGVADIYTIINTNPSPDRLVFKAFDVPFGPSGFIGNTKLMLGTNVSVTLSNAVKLNLLGNENTCVSFDCNGFSGMSVQGEVEFCRKYIVPLAPGILTPKPEPETVKAHFLAQMPAWGEFIVDLSVEPFALTNHDSIKWQVNRVVFDFSSSSTPPDINFPPNYASPFVQNNNGVMIASPLWRGFYLDDIVVTLPRQFGSNAGSDLSIGAQDVIFDDTGLTGKIFASPLLSLCEGNLGGWAFSIDTFAIQVTRNRLDGFTFNGMLNLPIFSKNNGSCAQPDECVRYEAVILPGNIYSFSVKPLGQYQANVWKATVTLEPNSAVEIKYVNGEFLAAATLTGFVSIDGDLGQNFTASIPEIFFQNLVLRNKAPYFEPGIWSVPGASVGVGFGGFGLVVDSIRMVKVPNSNDRANLKFRVGLIIVDEDIGLLMVDGGFQLKGQLLIQNNRQRWVYDGLLIDDVMIDASFPGVERVYGKLSFFGQEQPHASLGRGFSGKVFVDFQGIDAELVALGVFGNQGSYKYFMIDALAKFNPGIGAGALRLVGFGGGASYHMDIIGDLDTGLPADIANVDPLTISLGASLSGLVYAPDDTKGINIRATVVLALVKEEAFNVNATFGLSFYDGGGLDKIYFKGTARFMDNLDFTAEPKYIENAVPELPSAICAFVNMSYSFGEKSFHAYFKVKIDAVNVLEGQGHAELMIKPGYWFINVGTPKNPVFVAFTIPGLNLKVAEVAFYFDIGRNIPPFPGLPSNVASLTGMGNIVANEALRRTGNGFATGMRFDASTGDLKFLIFYARFDLGAGFDLMVQDYGDAVCANINNEPLGINGWYASGQLWAYVSGKVGIRVRIWGKKRNFDILSLSAAAALQAKFPHPFYARGAVGGRYRILGGLIKGSCRFEFSVGKECQMVGGSDPWADQDVILALSPVDSLENVHTLTIPAVDFTVPISKDLNDGNNTWRAELAHADIVNDGIILGDEKTLMEENTSLEVKPANVLPANKWLAFKVKVVVLKNGEFFKSEEKEIAFKTGDAPTVIPVDNVQHAYPIDGQYNFYKQEHPNGKGFIKLKFGQPELFQNVPAGFVRTMRLTRLKYLTNNTIEFPFTYNESERRVEFTLPGTLQNGEAYRLEMVNKAVAGNKTAEDNGENEDGEDVPPVMYQVNFRVSQYNKFADKVEALKQNMQISAYSTGWIRAVSTLSEPLDYFEIYGGNDDETLVGTTLDMNNLIWFNQNRKYLKLAYNYSEEAIDDTELCYLGQFTNTNNVFDLKNFSIAEIGFEEMLGNPVLKLNQDGIFPSLTDTVIQYLDFTSLNAFNEMWGNMKMDLLSYKALKCNGANWYGNSAANCTNFTYCCVPGQQYCCTSECAYEGNPDLKKIADNDMPVPPGGSKFLVTINYIIPGHGLTTTKVIEIVKP